MKLQTTLHTCIRIYLIGIGFISLALPCHKNASHGTVQGFIPGIHLSETQLSGTKRMGPTQKPTTVIPLRGPARETCPGTQLINPTQGPRTRIRLKGPAQSSSTAPKLRNPARGLRTRLREPAQETSSGNISRTQCGD